MIVIASWILLFLGFGMFAWFFAIRGRGSLRYWIRTFQVEEQWDIEPSAKVSSPSGLSRLAESTYQLRNNLVIPLLATWIALALIGTAQPVMLVFGILLICFLFGACKFVFVHQMPNEADEIHLQNY